jgi:hypothetical protein
MTSSVHQDTMIVGECFNERRKIFERSQTAV